MTNQQLFSEHNQRIASEDAQLDDISAGLGTINFNCTTTKSKSLNIKKTFLENYMIMLMLHKIICIQMLNV
eukprot:UN01681